MELSYFETLQSREIAREEMVNRPTVIKRSILALGWLIVSNLAIAEPYESELFGRTLDVAVVPFQSTSFTRPLEGVTTTVYLGDNMITQKTGYFALCMNIIVAQRSKDIDLSEGEICQHGKGDLWWYSKDQRSLIKRKNGYVVESDWALRVTIERKKKGLYVCNRGASFSGSCIKNIDPRFFEETDTELLIEGKDALQQNIEYLGKEGDILRFAYSETQADIVTNPATGRFKTVDFARDAFTREFVVDLSEDNIVAFKGALIEIEAATSSRIVYKIIRNFAGR